MTTETAATMVYEGPVELVRRGPGGYLAPGWIRGAVLVPASDEAAIRAALRRGVAVYVTDRPRGRTLVRYLVVERGGRLWYRTEAWAREMGWITPDGALTEKGRAAVVGDFWGLAAQGQG